MRTFEDSFRRLTSSESQDHYSGQYRRLYQLYGTFSFRVSLHISVQLSAKYIPQTKTTNREMLFNLLFQLKEYLCSLRDTSVQIFKYKTLWRLMKVEHERTSEILIPAMFRAHGQQPMSLCSVQRMNDVSVNLLKRIPSPGEDCHAQFSCPNNVHPHSLTTLFLRLHYFTVSQCSAQV